MSKPNKNIKNMEEIKMKKFIKGLCMVLAVVVCLMGVQPVSAKVKYTKTEQKLAGEIAYYQLCYIDIPDSFKIQKITKINYTVNDRYAKTLEKWGLKKSRETLKWKVDYTERNESGETVNGVIYFSSKFVPYYGDINEIPNKYNDNTDYSKREPSKKFVKNVKKLAKQTYDQCEEWW